jgi:hypothetical protein
MVGGHQGFDVVASPVIVPPNAGSGAGICLPGMVVVALGEPSTPVTVCAKAGAPASTAAAGNSTAITRDKLLGIFI